MQEFFLTFKSTHELRRALIEIDDKYDGYRFIRNIRKQVLLGAIVVSDEQMAALNSVSDYSLREI